MTDKPKFSCSMGDPLDMLAEEASEIIQAIMKQRRFGWRGAVEAGYIGQNPRDQLHQEIGDFLAVLGHLIAEGVIDTSFLLCAIEIKRHKVKALFGTELKQPPVMVRLS